MRQFNVGDVVTCIPDMFLRYAAPGAYKVIAAMPDRDGDHMYRIKSPVEEHERVVKESLLVKPSSPCPNRFSKARFRSIRRPKLRNVDGRECI